jgi:hypothetical protein
MMKTRNTLFTALAAVMMIGSILACNLDVKLPSNPQPPIPSLVASDADANAFEQNFQQAVNQGVQNGTFTASVTQQQLSSWLLLRAGDFARQNNQEWPLKNVQAGLNDGKITLYGVIVKEGVPETPAQVIFTPSIDGNGELAVKIDSAQVGVVGVPNSVLDDLTKTLKDTLTAQLGQIKGKYKLTTLTIANGSLTIGGQVVRN